MTASGPRGRAVGESDSAPPTPAMASGVADSSGVGRLAGAVRVVVMLILVFLSATGVELGAGRSPAAYVWRLHEPMPESRWSSPPWCQVQPVAAAVGGRWHRRQGEPEASRRPGCGVASARRRRRRLRQVSPSSGGPRPHPRRANRPGRRWCEAMHELELLTRLAAMTAEVSPKPGR